MRKGDKIVCINADGGYLTLNKVYMINFIGDPKNFSGIEVIYVWDDRNQIDWYNKRRFVLDKKFIRKQKLQRINEKA